MFASKFVILFIFSSIYSVQAETVNLTLYFESLCPFCHEFIVEQLYPGYTYLRDSIKVDLIPFGKAHSNLTDNGIEWTCQHGPVECYLNKIYACVVNFNLPQSQTLGYILCATIGSSRNSTKEQIEALAWQCTENIVPSWDNITTCLTDGTADTLLLGYEDLQSKLDPPIDYVPNIRFNNVYDDDLENQARFDFKWTVCQLFTEDIPSVCDSL